MFYIPNSLRLLDSEWVMVYIFGVIMSSVNINYCKYFVTKQTSLSSALVGQKHTYFERKYTQTQ